jgi:hypothetical protein
VVNFLEIFNVTFTIYAENVQYNLIQMDPDRKKRKAWQDELANLDAYRVFSQLRMYRRDDPEDDPAMEAASQAATNALIHQEETIVPVAVSVEVPQLVPMQISNSFLNLGEESTEIQV